MDCISYATDIKVIHADFFQRDFDEWKARTEHEKQGVLAIVGTDVIQYEGKAYVLILYRMERKP